MDRIGVVLLKFTIVIIFGLLLGCSSGSTVYPVNRSPSVVTPVVSSVNLDGYFKVKKTEFFDSVDSAFVMRGCNIPLFWFSNNYSECLDASATLGSNAVRLVWMLDETTFSPKLSVLEQALNKSLSLKMLPIVELHDYTGINSEDSLLKAATYFARADVQAVLKKHETSLIINIANEWGDYSISSKEWKNAYLKAIKIIRRAGYKCPIMIDAADWGKRITDFTEYGVELLNSDTCRNLMFSAHAYSSSIFWKNNVNYAQNIQSVKDKGLCLVIGEFGWDAPVSYFDPQGLCDVDAPKLMKACEDKKVGYLSWSWYGNNLENELLDLCKSWSDTSKLTEWGRLWVYDSNGIKKTSRIAKSFK